MAPGGCRWLSGRRAPRPGNGVSPSPEMDVSLARDVAPSRDQNYHAERGVGGRHPV